jgi:hypothetical protein
MGDGITVSSLYLFQGDKMDEFTLAFDGTEDENPFAPHNDHDGDRIVRMVIRHPHPRVADEYEELCRRGRHGIRLVDVKTIPFCGPDHANILTTLFGPLISKIQIKDKRVLSVPVYRFLRKSGISTDVLSVTDELYAAGMDFILAGGKLIDFCNNVPMGQSFNDYDIWFLNRENLLKTCSLLIGQGYYMVADKGHVIEYVHLERKIKLQLIKTIYSCIEEILEVFDLRCCAVAYDGKRIHWLRHALKDIKYKRIVVKNLEPYPMIWVRIAKYISKGYTLTAPDAALASIAFLMSIENKASELFTQRDRTWLDMAVERADDDYTSNYPI